MKDDNGSRLGQEVRPLDRVAVYVPGGRAAYPSTVLMTVVPAVVAGVREIVLVSPPSADALAERGGARRGAHRGRDRGSTAWAARRRSRRWPTARRPSAAWTRSSGPATSTWRWPSAACSATSASTWWRGRARSLVVADDTADAGLVAADLLAQAEHDPMARAVLLTPSRRAARRGGRRARPAARGAAAAGDRGGRARDATARSCSRASLEEAVDAREPARARAPGAAGRGSGGPAARGCGTRARCSSAPTRPRWSATTWRDRTTCCRPAAPRASPRRSATEDFVKRPSVIEYSPEGLVEAGPHVGGCRRVEGLDGHGAAAAIRIASAGDKR